MQRVHARNERDRRGPIHHFLLKACSQPFGHTSGILYNLHYRTNGDNQLENSLHSRYNVDAIEIPGLGDGAINKKWTQNRSGNLTD